MEILTNSFGLVIFKLVLAVVLGALLGLERSLAHKTAGMRTFALVSMGAALFVIVSAVAGDHYLQLGALAVDPLRVASQIIVGIGFLGAGLIIFQGNKIYGLTTAAGLWVAAGVGMAAGFGLFSLALVVTLLTLLVFTVLWFVERYLENNVGRGENN